MSFSLPLFFKTNKIKNINDIIKTSTASSKKVVSLKKEKTTKLIKDIKKAKPKIYPYFVNIIHGIKRIDKINNTIRSGSLNNMIILQILS